MINHIWIALIIIAVVYAAVRDIRGDEVKSEPAAEIAMVQSSLPASGRLDYDFATQENPRIELSMPIDSDAGSPAAVSTQVMGKGGEHLLVAEIIDADGDLFLAPFSMKFGVVEEWKKGEFQLGDLIPDPSNPVASPDKPYTFSAIRLTRSKASGVSNGFIEFNDFVYRFDKSYVVPSDLEADSWMGVLTKSSSRWAEIAITLAIEYIGIMMLWLGIMRIAEKAGLVQLLARVLKPVMTRLFPDLPPEGEAMGAIIMNMSANILGLGNAATPLGLKAMEELQRLNTEKEYASNAMCMLLSVNTSSVTLITPAIFGFRAASGSQNIMMFWPVMIGATCCSTIAAITACKLLEKLPVFQIPTRLHEEVKGL